MLCPTRSPLGTCHWPRHTPATPLSAVPSLRRVCICLNDGRLGVGCFVACSTSQGTVHVVERSITEFGLHRGERLASIVPEGGRNSTGSDWSVSAVRIAEGATSEYVAFATASGMVAVYCLSRESTRKVHSWRADSAKVGTRVCHSTWQPMQPHMAAHVAPCDAHAVLCRTIASHASCGTAKAATCSVQTHRAS